MKPRTAGILGMIAGLVITVFAGLMIAHPPLSIVGAIVLVAGTILFALAATWTVRKSWDASSWPDASVSEQKGLRRSRRLAIIKCVAAPLLVGAGVWQVAIGGFGWINILVGAMFLATSVTTLRALRKVAERG